MTGRTRLIRAVKSQPWPGAANLEVSLVWGRRGAWQAPVVLDGREVPEIDGFLDVPGRVRGKAHPLKANEGGSFIGSYVLGEGFVLTPKLAGRILAKTPHGRQGQPGRQYADVLFPYLVGEDLNQRPDQSPSRWVINFHDWPWRRATETDWAVASDGQREQMIRHGVAAPDYPYPVARDYPICARILRSLVFPERTRKNQNGDFALRYPLYLRWWQYAEKRPGMNLALKDRKYAIITGLVTKYLVSNMDGGLIVFDHQLGVFPNQ